jgi:hypothetical protein
MNQKEKTLPLSPSDEKVEQKRRIYRRPLLAEMGLLEVGREKVLARFKIDPVTKCWQWTGGISPYGYGIFCFSKHGNFMAHRMSYEIFRGPIPKDLCLDHLCRNRSCINPDHLELVTLYENIHRGIGESATNKRKTHCLRGHPYDEENTIFRLPKNGQPFKRVCRKCLSLWQANQRLRKAAKKLNG